MKAKFVYWMIVCLVLVGAVLFWPRNSAITEESLIRADFNTVRYLQSAVDEFRKANKGGMPSRIEDCLWKSDMENIRKALISQGGVLYYFPFSTETCGGYNIVLKSARGVTLILPDKSIYYIKDQPVRSGYGVINQPLTNPVPEPAAHVAPVAPSRD